MKPSTTYHLLIIPFLFITIVTSSIYLLANLLEFLLKGQMVYHLNFLVDMDGIRQTTVVEGKVEVDTGTSIICLGHPACYKPVLDATLWGVQALC